MGTVPQTGQRSSSTTRESTSTKRDGSMELFYHNNHAGAENLLEKPQMNEVQTRVKLFEKNSQLTGTLSRLREILFWCSTNDELC